jgi:uncharacterized protein (DUF488 family)
MDVYTIGYEGLDLDEFLSFLNEHGIDTIIDVREIPLSRKFGFSKKSLANALNLSGLEYFHLGELGCPKIVRDRYRDNGDWKQYTDGFLRYLQTQNDAIAELSVLVSSGNCALLCYEADPNFCHRSMVANAVKEFSDANVTHLKATVKKVRTAASARAAYA